MLFSHMINFRYPAGILLNYEAMLLAMSVHHRLALRMPIHHCLALDLFTGKDFYFVTEAEFTPY